MSDDVKLLIADKIHGGWKTVTITRSMETLAGTFNLTLSDRWPGQTTPRPVKAGSSCTLKIGDETVITGYIDDATPNVASGSHTVSVSGRDRAGDLVDCSVVQTPGEWKDQKLTEIVRALCQPFDVNVDAEIDIGKAFSKFKLNEGETAFEAIDRACRMRAVLAMSDGFGGLNLTRADQAAHSNATLKTGKDGNVLKASGGSSMRDRFSKIIVKGQAAGNDFTSAEDNAEPNAEAVDPGVNRYRPLIIIGEDQGDGATFLERAKWEASVRRARALKADITVQGWKHKTGLWRPLTLVAIDIPELGLTGDMLITSTTMTLDGNGRTTRLSLAPAKAFELIALKDDEVETGW